MVNTLSLINKNVKDCKIDYNIKSAKILIDSDTGKVKETIIFSEDNKKGYNRYTGIMINENLVVIDCREKKIVSCSFEG